MLPFQIRRFCLNNATGDDARWLSERLDRESARLGMPVRQGEDGSLVATGA